MRRAAAALALVLAALAAAPAGALAAPPEADPASQARPRPEVEEGRQARSRPEVEEGRQARVRPEVEEGRQARPRSEVEEGRQARPRPEVEEGRQARHETPLAGRTVVIDPGHQLGNHHFPAEIERLVPAGGTLKPCNTTGTATADGYPEATLAWQVSRVLERRLTRLGARVVLTRTSNREDRWGPCVDARGLAGNALGADLKISIHADGSAVPGAHGFHVIAPADVAPWTSDIHVASGRLALAVRAGLLRAGLPVANYVAGGDGLDVRSDLATLNLSDVPTVLVELGNMRHPDDAALMTSRAGRSAYARALLQGIRRFR